MTASNESGLLTVHIGAVTGLIFGLVDMDRRGDGSEDFCLDWPFQELPADFPQLAQLVAIVTPERLGACPNSRELDGCTVRGRVCKRIPQGVDVIVRSWFPALRARELRWKETSISFGGSLFAAAYLLRRQEWNGERPLTLAFWPATRHVDEPGEWEELLVQIRGKNDPFFELIVKRNNFGVIEDGDNLIQRADDALRNAWLPKADAVLQELRKRLPLNRGNQICLAVADFDRQRGAAQVMGRQLIPFIPINVGEVHNVVPLGEGLDECREILQESEWENRFEFWRALSQIFSNREERGRLMKMLGVEDSSRPVDWKSDSPIGSYQGGWTFVRIERQYPGLHPLPVHFLTLEPEYPLYPFGQSHTGALAASVARHLLLPQSESTTTLRGRSLGEERPWIARAFARLAAKVTSEPWPKTIEVTRRSATYNLVAPVRYMGAYTVEDPEFIRGGLE